MELKEPIDRINWQLERKYGKFEDGRQFFRVVWSDDQLEKRFGTYVDTTESGIFIREVTEVREVPKYPHVEHKYVLEGLRVIPIINEKELPVAKVSYELIWAFMDSNENYLPPQYIACQYVIEQLRRNMEGEGPTKPQSHEEYLKERGKEYDRIYEALYGNESSMGDSLAFREGVGYTGKGKHHGVN